MSHPSKDLCETHLKVLMRRVSRTSCCHLTIAILCMLLSSCNSQRLQRKPSLEIMRVPVADPGGPEKLDYIEGRSSNSDPGQQIVLYAHSGGVWWIQPFADHPFTKIQSDSTWKNATHLGTEYAALLVNSAYRPASKLTALPQKDSGVSAIATAQGRPGRPDLSRKLLRFSGYDWVARSASSDRGGVSNPYDPANAWTDPNGYLHLRMDQRNGRWYCAEVNLTRSLGFGTYRFVVHNTAHIGPSAVVSMFTYDEISVEDARRELDVELSRWGNPASKNAQFVVQPFYVPENVIRFDAPSGPMTYTFRWQPESVAFKAIRGSAAGASAPAVSQHVFNSGIPQATGQTVHLDVYNFHYSGSSLQQPVEVVIEKFEYLP
jgi:hypothetical protein